MLFNLEDNAFRVLFIDIIGVIVSVDNDPCIETDCANQETHALTFRLQDIGYLSVCTSYLSNYIWIVLYLSNHSDYSVQ